MPAQGRGTRVRVRVRLQQRRVAAGEVREQRQPRLVRPVQHRRVGAVDVEDEHRPGRADELPLQRVRLARVGEPHIAAAPALDQSGVPVRAGDDPRGPVLRREIDQGANRVAGVPHAGRDRAAPIDVKGLLAVPGPWTERPHREQAIPVAEYLRDRCEDPRVAPGGVEDLVLDQVFSNLEPSAALLGDGVQLLQAGPHRPDAPWFDDPLQGEEAIGVEPLTLARGQQIHRRTPARLSVGDDRVPTPLFSFDFLLA